MTATPDPRPRVPTTPCASGRPPSSRRDVRPPERGAPARRPAPVHGPRRRVPRVGRRRQRVRRLHVQLRPDRARPPPPRRRGSRRGPAAPGRLPERAGRGDGGAGREAGRGRSTTPTGRCSPRTAPTPPPRASPSPGPPRSGARCSWPRAPTTAPLRGARRTPPAPSPEDRAHLLHFTFNDLKSAIAAVDEAGDDLAAIVVSPFRHDARHDQELVDPEFAARPAPPVRRPRRRARSSTTCAAASASPSAGSWEPLGVAPDLSAWSKAIANGYPLAAVLGNDRFRAGAASIFVTGSFWFSAVAMAAARGDDRRARAPNTPWP